MDHLPLPRDPLLDPIEVPYRCTEEYDGGPMLSYPERHGWQVMYHPGGFSYLVDGEKPSNSQLEAFLQNWMYFGLLSEVLGRFSDFRSFIASNENGEKIVTTQHLHQCCKEWKAELEDSVKQAKPGQPKGWEHANKIVGHVWKVTLGSKGRLKNNEIDPRIWLSICVLAESIEQVIVDIVYDAETGTFEPVGHTWRSPGNPQFGEFILEEMKEKGWCPFDVSILNLTTKTGSLLYYLANLPPTRSHANHESCTADRCTAMTIDSSYRTSHAPTDCHCEEKFGDVEAVNSVLQGDEIPLIERATDAPNSSKSSPFRILEGSSESEFVAISHVWAEGLGNYYSNTLPSCSIKRISDLVDNAFAKDDKSIPFWLDTICVPVEPEEMRIRALNRLRKPYQDAKHVLVLDSYLYTLNMADLSPLEAWARVLICSWSRRLWTFQEGRLAKDLLYQFADRALRMEDLFIAIDEGAATRPLVDEIMTAYRGNNVIRNLGAILPDELREQFRREPTVRDMRESLKGRAVSVRSDEALCLFCNMGLDMSLVTDLPPEERMPKFWSEVKDIPVGLLFSTSESKLTQPGLRWAPTSFMGELDTAHWYLEQCLEPRIDAHSTPTGLHAQLPSVLFSPKLLNDDSSFDTLFTENWLDLQDSNGAWYFSELHLQSNGGAYWNQSRTQSPRKGAVLAMLLVKLVSEWDREETENEFDFRPGIQGVLGTLWNAGEESGVPRFEGVRHTLLHRYSDAFSRYLSQVAACVEVFVHLDLGMVNEDEEENKEGSHHAEENEGDEADEGDNSSNGLGEEANAIFALAEDKPIESPEVNGSSSSSPPLENAEADNKRETLDTFILTQARREACQAFAEIYVQRRPEAKEIALKVGHSMGRSEEESFDHFAKMARFQLQMRLRNRIMIGEQTQAFIID
ncbi:uncharacterized protein PAC_07711 [Phialocephala subalpina]|uniref:Heterokaryon incompatibility domain-containing protein n=1 Tax=Phialocephala subalpina TaxID=576137 RepID=A0A1L7WYI1_9HELO|nr:uncharacterized protein PAC_07711 [Phialocephala subalpina]